MDRINNNIHTLNMYIPLLSTLYNINIKFVEGNEYLSKYYITLYYYVDIYIVYRHEFRVHDERFDIFALFYSNHCIQTVYDSTKFAWLIKFTLIYEFHTN